MFDLIEDFLTEMMEETLSSFGDLISGFSDNIVDYAFHAEEHLEAFMGNDIGEIYSVIQAFALYLIVLKFLKKGFDTYVLWSDGDSDMDPVVMLTGFFKAVIVTLCFGTIYDIMVNVSTDMIDKLLEKIMTVDVGIGGITVTNFLAQMIVQRFSALIISIIFLVVYLIIFLKVLKKGLEIFVLKVGVSLACVGMMDSDGGVFKIYLKKFFQEIFSVMLQIVFLKIALFLMFGYHYLWGFAAMSLALSAPQFLNEFIMVSTGGGAMSKVSSTMYMASMAKSMVKR